MSLNFSFCHNYTLFGIHFHSDFLPLSFFVSVYQWNHNIFPTLPCFSCMYNLITPHFDGYNSTLVQVKVLKAAQDV